MTDKRKVSTDALETLGTIIGPNEKRDAIHLAVIPVIAKEHLKPGQDVGIDGTSENPIGIVDPFIRLNPHGWGYIHAGERFWLVIYPRKINSLRHVWTHPDIPDDEASNFQRKTEIEKSKEWVTNFVNMTAVSMGYEEFMEAAHSYLENGDRINQGSDLEGYIVPDEFWYHYEVITGKKVNEASKGSFFTCSC
jgi:hypothetical protein